MAKSYYSETIPKRQGGSLFYFRESEENRAEMLVDIQGRDQTIKCVVTGLPKIFT